MFRDCIIGIDITPTERCNLDCKYCFQHDNSSPVMDLDMFKKIVQKGISVGAIVYTFMGGEPTIWKHLEDAISYCNERNLITEITTNGILLNKERIVKLGKSGLDLINVSMDEIVDTGVSGKNLIKNPEMLENLESCRKKYGIHIKFNAVITKQNIDHISKLLEVSKQTNIPISIGLVVKPPLNMAAEWPLNSGLTFDNDIDRVKLGKVMDLIIKRKKQGYPIVDPVSYFKDYKKYFNKEQFWDCKILKRHAICVNPEGFVYRCAKLNSVSKYKFIHMDEKSLLEFQEELSILIDKCNPDCYSNCAYDLSYFLQHKFRFLSQPFYYNIIRNKDIMTSFLNRSSHNINHPLVVRK
jgi:MoaA/NifB/PqqE/SkfB family radical SAM enzyme